MSFVKTTAAARDYILGRIRHRASAWAACGFLSLAASALLAGPGNANYDPNATVTIYVHGLEAIGAVHHGVYGDDFHESLLDTIASFAGLPTIDRTGGSPPPNVVAATTYYGDTAPSYYSVADVAEIDRVTAQWGGGVPRYALIVAKYARHILERSGAQQVNFVSVSFGSLVVRWLIEKNVGGLAGEGRIARWLTVAGVIGGNWAASRDQTVDFLSSLGAEPIDLRQMDYGWIDTYLHAPRIDADSPYYAGILIGQVGGTDDGLNNGALSALMMAYREYQPNDGLQALPDATFHSVAQSSRLLGMPPTLSLFHADHEALKRHTGAWAEAATFITQRRRVTVTMTSARVTNLHERQVPYLNWPPAEVVFESRVSSPAARARWGVTEPLSVHVRGDATAPLRRYTTAGETQSFAYVMFDDLVLAQEAELSLELEAEEIDYDPHYGIAETVTPPYYGDLGGGTVVVSTVRPGTYTLRVADWSCEVAVRVFDYPFELAVSVPDGIPAGDVTRLVTSPNPFSSTLRITAAGAALGAGNGSTELDIYDVGGRLLRCIRGDLRAGFVWDGRDAQGRLVPAGVYLHRVVARGLVLRGRSYLAR